MSIEYKIMNTNKNISLTDDEIKLSKIKSKCCPGGEKPTKSKATVGFVDFEKRNNQRLDKLENNVSS